MEPENDGLEDDYPFQLGGFRFHVNLPGCNIIIDAFGIVGISFGYMYI